MPPTEATCLIRPDIFVAASKLAHGECVNLTIPALASIYRGLNRISMARNFTKLEAIFLIHYVYGWLGTYFRTHFEYPYHRHSLLKMVKISSEKMNRTPDMLEARELLKCKDLTVMHYNTLTKTPIPYKGYTNEFNRQSQFISKLEGVFNMPSFWISDPMARKDNCD